MSSALAHSKQIHDENKTYNKEVRLAVGNEGF